MKSLRCLLTGHQYYVVQKFSTYSRRVACARCKKSWAMNDDVRSFLLWDAETEELYRFMGYKIINPWR